MWPPAMCVEAQSQEVARHIWDESKFLSLKEDRGPKVPTSEERVRPVDLSVATYPGCYVG